MNLQCVNTSICLMCYTEQLSMINSIYINNWKIGQYNMSCYFYQNVLQKECNFQQEKMQLYLQKKKKIEKCIK